MATKSRIDRLEDDFEARPTRTVLKVMLWVVAVAMLLGLGSCAMGLIANPFFQAARIVNKTIDADNVIYNYEWFKRQHEDIRAFDAQVANAQQQLDLFTISAGPRDKWTFEDKGESQRLSSIVLGLKNQRVAMVAEYNAKSRMVNRSIFKTGDSELPERME